MDIFIVIYKNQNYIYYISLNERKKNYILETKTTLPYVQKLKTCLIFHEEYIWNNIKKCVFIIQKEHIRWCSSLELLIWTLYNRITSTYVVHVTSTNFNSATQFNGIICVKVA